MLKKCLLLIILVFFFIGWSTDPNVNTPVCTGESERYGLQMIPDGSGGAIIVWLDKRNGSDTDVYAQRVKHSGTVLWTTNGVPVCTAAGNQNSCRVVPDNQGGAIISWTDSRVENDSNIYAQRIDPTGTVLWTANGVPVCAAAGTQYVSGMVPDTHGGSIIAWHDERFENNESIYAQRISAAGSVLLKANGRVVFSAPGELRGPGIVPDTQGGAYIAWLDERSGNFNIYAQRINGSGSALWAAGGVGIYPKNDDLHLKGMIVNTNGDTIIAFSEKYNDEEDFLVEDVYALCLDSSGQLIWNNRKFVGGYSDGIRELDMIADDSGGAYIGYENFCFCGYFFSSLSIKHIDPFGGVQALSRCDSPPCPGDGNQSAPKLVSDGSGGVILVWINAPDDWNYDGNDELYAQRIDYTGSARWENQVNGYLPVSMAPGWKYHKIISNGYGGAIIAWLDGRNGEADIYAQSVCADGKLGDCIQPIAVIEADRFGGIAPVTIHFDGSNSYDPGGTVARWKWSFGDGSTATEKIVSHTYTNPGTYRVSLRVKDKNGRWSDEVQETVQVFSLNSLNAKIEFDSEYIKVDGKGIGKISAACYTKTGSSNKRSTAFSGIPANPNASLRALPGDTITIDLGLTFKTTSGTLQENVSFDTLKGYYSQYLRSGAAGTAKVSAVIDGYELASGTVEFTWPKPPADLQVELKVNRSLFMGEYHAYLSWAENPDEVFTPEKYRVYRSTNGGAFKLVVEVDASTFTYVDSSLPAGNQYRFAVSMVDSEGDESPVVQDTN